MRRKGVVGGVVAVGVVVVVVIGFVAAVLEK
jgi:hypothetical protein